MSKIFLSHIDKKKYPCHFFDFFIFIHFHRDGNTTSSGLKSNSPGPVACFSDEDDVSGNQNNTGPCIANQFMSKI